MDDLISRARVIEWLENATDDSIEHAIDSNLEFIPSIQTEQKTGITIPDNATNGDVFSDLFSKAEIITNAKLGKNGTVFADFENNIIIFDLKWWNAPYKREEE